MSLGGRLLDVLLVLGVAEVLLMCADLVRGVHVVLEEVAAVGASAVRDRVLVEEVDLLERKTAENSQLYAPCTVKNCERTPWSPEQSRW